MRRPYPRTSVSTLFESHYRPQNLAGKSAKAHSIYRTAIKWLCQSLGRDARISDLTFETFTAFYRYCAEHGLSPATIENHRQRLSTLISFAFEIGIITERPPIPPVEPRHSDKPCLWNEAGTLAHFYANTFKPETLSHMNAAYVANFDAAVKAYVRFAGHNVAPESLSQDSITEFAKWLQADGGYSAFVIAKYPTIITRIWRQHSPEKAPPLPIRHGEVAIDGSLWHFFDGDYLGEHPIKPSTDSSYRVYLRNFDKYLGRAAMLSDLNATTINGYLIKREKTQRPRTVLGERTFLLSLWRAAHEWGHLPDLPRRVRKIKRDQLNVDAFTPAEMSALFAAASGEAFNQLSGHIHLGRFLTAMLGVGYDTGLRLSDILSLTRDQLRSDGMIVTVQAKTGYTKSCLVRPATMEAIAAAAVDGDARLLPWSHLNKARLFKLWRRLLQTAGLPVHRRNGIQKLRRTSATMLERELPGSASWHLGHKSADLARAHYLDPRQCSRPMLPPEVPKSDAA